MIREREPLGQPMEDLGHNSTLLTALDVASELCVSVSWVRDHAIGRRQPALPAIRMGGILRFRRTDIDTFLELHTRNQVRP
jgi:hypothetical protein